jgi:CheY-like chemotaxis protein
VQAADSCHTDAVARILIVDDEPDIRQLVRIMLSVGDHEVIEAGDVPEARKLLADGPLPDVVFLDWMMPGLPGTELLREMRASQDLRDIPIVMLTARSLIEQKEEAESLGATAFLVKPFDVAQLRDVLARALVNR